MPVRLDTSFEVKGDTWRLCEHGARVDARDNFKGSVLGSWWELWEAQQLESFADLATAAKSIDQRRYL